MHDLAARLARGDENAFAELYAACADGLHRYLTSSLRSHEAASDVLQDVFLRAAKSRRRFRTVQNPVAYLFQIARNEAARVAKRSKAPLVLNEETHIATSNVRRQEDAEVAAAALARLTAEDRELVELKIFAGLTFGEVAAVTGMPQGTVATRYRRALESLRPWLTKQLR